MRTPWSPLMLLFRSGFLGARSFLQHHRPGLGAISRDSDLALIGRASTRIQDYETRANPQAHKVILDHDSRDVQFPKWTQKENGEEIQRKETQTRKPSPNIEGAYSGTHLALPLLPCLHCDVCL
jgi:hypothetical protein